MSKLGDELVQSMAQALAHAQGKRSGVRTHKVSVSPDEIQNARKQLGLSQDQFADAFGVSASTLRKWEQGQRSPTGAAKTLLKIIEREPRAVVRARKRARSIGGNDQTFVVLASMANLFLGSSGLQWAISVVGVFVFAGLTAWDTQRLKDEYIYGAMDGETAERSAIMGALSLYLDFVNLFTMLLQLLGQRED